MTFEEAAAVMMGGSGTGANASLFSAICSLPVVAEMTIKVDGSPTAYSIKTFRTGIGSTGFGNVGTLGFVTSDGDANEPPADIYTYHNYFSAVSMGDNILFIPCDSNSNGYYLPTAYYHTQARYEGYSNAGVMGGGTVHYKSTDDSFSYTLSGGNIKASGGYICVYYNAEWDRQCDFYNCDYHGNITIDSGSSYTDSGVYSNVMFGKFPFNIATTSKMYFLHGYEDEAAFREMWRNFCSTMSGGEIS